MCYQCLLILCMQNSIMAGFAMMGVDYEGSGILNISLLSEYRGNSYAIGGDTNAVTIANFMKKYNPKIQGASVLSHLASLCNGESCGFPASLCKFNENNILSKSY